MKEHDSCDTPMQFFIILVWLNDSHFMPIIILKCFSPINKVKDLGSY